MYIRIPFEYIMHISTYSHCCSHLYQSQGKAIDESYTGAPLDHTDIHLSDSDYDEDLDKVDTMLHFGGGKFDKANARESNPYGGGGGSGNRDMGEQYRSRKEELEERIKMKKMMKVDKMKRKEDQGTFFYLQIDVIGRWD